MTEAESKRPLERTPSKLIKKTLNDYKLGISNITYQVSLAKDGDAWCALIGHNIQDGVSGFGVTVQEALRDLADRIED
ncbi:MAG: hypothetical protein Q8M40_12245 [Legionella sp.]|nr:hypothetical protein [Legionella sp.]